MNKYFIFIIIGITLASCQPHSANFYQFYKVEYDSTIKQNNDVLEYDDQNSTIRYSLFAESGSLSFSFFNKTDKNIYLDLSDSYVVINGVAKHYFKNRIFTSTAASASQFFATESNSKSVLGTNYLDVGQSITNQRSYSSSNSMQVGLSVAYAEEKIVCIPPKTSKIFNEFNIYDGFIMDCDLQQKSEKEKVRSQRYSSKDSPLVISKQYSKKDSPLVFNNVLKYQIDNGPKVSVTNEFFVSEITNYPSNEIFEWNDVTICGVKQFLKVKSLKYRAPYMFYNIYKAY